MQENITTIADLKAVLAALAEHYRNQARLAASSGIGMNGRHHAGRAAGLLQARSLVEQYEQVADDAALDDAAVGSVIDARHVGA